MSENYAIENLAALDVSCLLWGDEHGEQWLESVGDDLRDDFVYDIAKRNREEFIRSSRLVFFRDQSNEGGSERW